MHAILDRLRSTPSGLGARKGPNMKRILGLALLALLCARVASAQDQAAYKLGVDDAVQVQVWQRADLSGTYVVDGDGNIVLPLLGAVPAKGLTADALAKDLERRYAILDPGISQVLVSVSRYSSRYLTVVGEVHNPGRYTFREMPALWDAILAAGGATSQADMASVQIVRKEKEGGETKTLTVDLSAGLESTPADSLPRSGPGTACWCRPWLRR